MNTDLVSIVFAHTAYSYIYLCYFNKDECYVQ